MSNGVRIKTDEKGTHVESKSSMWGMTRGGHAKKFIVDKSYLYFIINVNQGNMIIASGIERDPTKE